MVSYPRYLILDHSREQGESLLRYMPFISLSPLGCHGKLTVPTQEYSEGEAPNSSEIWGRAVATI